MQSLRIITDDVHKIESLSLNSSICIYIFEPKFPFFEILRARNVTNISAVIIYPYMAHVSPLLSHTMDYAHEKNNRREMHQVQ